MRGITMKKSEKVKGKERVAVKKKQNLMIAAGAVVIILLAVAAWYFFLNPSVARSGDTVAIFYNSTLDNGSPVESNLNSTPVVFTIGKDQIIPYGLPDAVIGMQLNETKTVILPPEKAFGRYDPTLIQVVNRSSIPPGTNFSVGNDYEIVRKSDNAVAHVRIMNVTQDTVTWDGNRAFAGQNLTLSLTLIQIVRK
jgi:peptidylprolyl isomerase